MNVSRRSFLAAAAGLLSALSSLDLLITQADGAAAAPATAVTLPPLTLRGYGTISGTFRSLHAGQSSLTHVTCDSPQKAHLVQAKYLSDLGLLAGGGRGDRDGLGPLDTRPAHGGGRHSRRASRTATDVLLLAAGGEAQFQEVCAAALPKAFTAVSDFGARVAVPMWLDRWDKYGVMSYYGTGQKRPRTAKTTIFDTDLQFAKDNGPLGLVLWTNALTEDTSEGMGSEQTWSYVQDRAKQLGVPVHINLSKLLAHRLARQPVPARRRRLKAPQFLGGFYGVAHDSAPLGPLTWSSQAGEDALLGVLQETVRELHRRAERRRLAGAACGDFGYAAGRVHGVRPGGRPVPAPVPPGAGHVSGRRVPALARAGRLLQVMGGRPRARNRRVRRVRAGRH